MTVNEMHIELRQSANQIGANKSRKYEPEELDWILNKMYNRFIQSKLKPKKDGSGGFELDQISADQIRTLIVPSYDLVPYVDDSRRYQCFLPADYAYLLSDWSATTLLCTGDTITETAENLYITAIRQDYSTGASPSGFYRTLKVLFPDATVEIPTDLPYGNNYQGYTKKTDISFLIPWIRAKGQYYWERFADLFYPGYYIHTSLTPVASPIPTIGITIDGITYHTYQYVIKNLVKHTGTGQIRDNRLTASNKISGLNSTPFWKSSHYSPVSELGNGILYIYRDNSFTVNGVSISYIRKPVPISLSLNTNCELPEEFHQTICDLATQYMAGRLKDGDAYQLDKDDNDTRVVL